MLQAGHELFSYPHFSIFSYIDKNSLSYVLIQPPTKFAKFGAIDRNLGCRPALTTFVMTFLTGYEELWNGNSRTFLSSTFMSKGDGLAVINEARSSTLRFRRASNAVVRQAIADAVSASQYEALVRTKL